MNIHEIILTLHMISQSLGKLANAPENYNCNASAHVEGMSAQLYKSANELLAIKHLLQTDKGGKSVRF